MVTTTTPTATSTTAGCSPSLASTWAAGPRPNDRPGAAAGVAWLLYRSGGKRDTRPSAFAPAAAGPYHRDFPSGVPIHAAHRRIDPVPVRRAARGRRCPRPRGARPRRHGAGVFADAVAGRQAPGVRAAHGRSRGQQRVFGAV